MRSSKQRSRSKQNRNRSVGNVVNRVFDSSGPEGKVRGTPQQIIDKYNQLARDAQLSGDRVATENFQQHAEHYTRMLAEAMAEQEARRDRQQRQQNNGQNNGQGHQQGNQHGNGQGGDPRDQRQDSHGGQPDLADAPQPDIVEPPKAAEPAPSNDGVIDGKESDSGLVETPEMKPAPKPRTRRPRKKPEEDGAAEAPKKRTRKKAEDSGDANPAEAAE